MKKKRFKRFWNKSKYKRKDSFNFRTLSSFDKWFLSGSPIKNDHNQRRAKDKNNIQKLKRGYSEEELKWYYKFEYYPEYY